MVALTSVSIPSSYVSSTSFQQRGPDKLSVSQPADVVFVLLQMFGGISIGAVHAGYDRYV